MPDRAIDELTLNQLREAVTEKSNRLAELWRKAGNDIDLYNVPELEGNTDERLDKLHQMGKEVDEYKAKLDIRQAIEKAATKERLRVEHMTYELNAPAEMPPSSQEARMGIGDLVVRSDEYVKWQGMENWPGKLHFDVDPRATGVGWQ